MIRSFIIISLFLFFKSTNAITLVNSTKISFTNLYVVPTDSTIKVNNNGEIESINLLRKFFLPAEKLTVPGKLNVKKLYDVILIDTTGFSKDNMYKVVMKYSILPTVKLLVINDTEIMKDYSFASWDWPSRGNYDLSLSIKNEGKARLVRLEISANDTLNYQAIDGMLLLKPVLPGEMKTFVQPDYIPRDGASIFLKYWTEYNGTLECKTGSFSSIADDRVTGKLVGRDITIEQPVSNNSNNSEGASMVVYDIVDEDAEFIGGSDAMSKFIACNLNVQNLKYQEDKRYMTWISFVIGKDGTVSDVKILKGSEYYEFNKEALAAVLKMPKWRPALFQGRPVSSRMKVPVYFASGTKPDNCK